ncbi:MAG: hypothetical protein ABI091_27295 [Ferruginibacter sp.]
MFLRGINYDVGTEFAKGNSSRPDFDETIVKKEFEIIKNELNCDAVRISGYDIERLSKASVYALEVGLQVWVSPAYIDATSEEALKYLVDCAKAAESLRKKYGNVIFVTGCEYSLFLNGFIKGENVYERLAKMFSPLSIVLSVLGLKNKFHTRLNNFLAEATSNIRMHFKGELTYSSGTWEKIDWRLFDMVGIDHYRASYNKKTYLKELHGYFKYGKPVAVLEFGCCSYKGAAEKGGSGFMIAGVKDQVPYIKGNHVRDESVQAGYIIEVLDLLQTEKIYGAFVYTFVNPGHKPNPDPHYDLDMASYAIVKPLDPTDENSYKGLPWIPKESFYGLGKYYKNMDKYFPSEWKSGIF